MKTPEEIEKLTNQTLNSLSGLMPAEANPFLFEKVKHRIIQQRQVSAAGHVRLMFRLSAVLLLFVGINVGSFYYFTKQDSPTLKATAPVKATGVEALSQEYFPGTNSYSY